MLQFIILAVEIKNIEDITFVSMTDDVYNMSA